MNNNNTTENTTRNTHTIDHAVNQVRNNTPNNPTNGFVPADNNVIPLPNADNTAAHDANNGRAPSNLEFLLNNDGSQAQAPVHGMQRLAISPPSEHRQSEVSNGSQQSQPLSSPHVVPNVNFTPITGAASSVYAGQEEQTIATLQRLHDMWMVKSGLMNQAQTLGEMQGHRREMDAIKAEIEGIKSTYHDMYPTNPAFFPPNYGQTPEDSASSQNVQPKASRPPKLPKEIPYLNTPSAQHSDPAARQHKFHTAEEWATKVDRVMNYNGFESDV